MGKDSYFIVISKVGVCPSLCLFSLTKRRRSSVSRAGALRTIRVVLLNSCFIGFFFFLKEGQGLHGIALSRWVVA